MLNKQAVVMSQIGKSERIILENMTRYADLRRDLIALVDNPSEEQANEIDADFQRISLGLEELGNAISVLAKILVSEDGLVDEIDGVEDENGIRLQ